MATVAPHTAEVPLLRISNLIFVYVIPFDCQLPTTVGVIVNPVDGGLLVDAFVVAGIVVVCVGDVAAAVGSMSPHCPPELPPTRSKAPLDVRVRREGFG